MAQNGSILLSLTVTVAQEFRKGAAVLAPGLTYCCNQTAAEVAGGCPGTSLSSWASPRSRRRLVWATLQESGLRALELFTWPLKLSRGNVPGARRKLRKPFHPSHGTPMASLLSYSISPTSHKSWPGFQGKEHRFSFLR